MTETLKSFLAGWAGGVGILAVGHPFDTVKTIYQNSPKGKYNGSMDVVKTLVREEGAGALYKGVTAPLAGIGTVFALYFLAYDSTERALRSLKGLDPANPLSMGDVLICGGSTGVVGSLVLGPAELIKVQQQTSPGVPVSQVVKEMWRQRAFGRGLSATMARDIPGSMAWFGAYEFTKMSICEDPKKPTVGQALCAGGMGGLGMWTTALPMDAIKTKVQANKTETLSLSQATKLIYNDAGIKGFYRGIGPVLLRAFPANAACFATKEMTQKFLDTVM